MTTIDKTSKSKHLLLKILYDEGSKSPNSDKNDFDYVSLDTIISNSCNLDKQQIQSLTNILVESKEIDVNLRKSRVSNIGISSYLNKKYWKIYLKSVFDYTKDVLQLAVLILTIFSLLHDKYSMKKDIEKIANKLMLIENQTKSKSFNKIN